MLVSSRPYGPLLIKGSPVKLRGVVLLQPPGEWPYWAQFWRDWDWTTIKRTIDNLATLGVNCIQVTATGLDDGGVTHPSDTVMSGRIAQLSAYTAARGMVLNPQLGYQPAHSFGTSVSVGTAAAVRMARLFMACPNLAFIDAMNEVNFYPAAGWSGPNAQAVSDLTAFVSAIRAVCDAVPVTLSVGCSGVGDYAGAWMQAVAPITDLQNVHTYTYQNSGGTAPLLSDLAAMRAASWYSGRFVVGETGVPSQLGSGLQTSWLNGNAAIAAAADCCGSILWGATDTSAASGRGENVSNFGLMDSTGTTFRTALSGPVAGWPAGL